MGSKRSAHHSLFKKLLVRKNISEYFKLHSVMHKKLSHTLLMKLTTLRSLWFVLLYGNGERCPGLEITAGQRTMSGLIGELTSQLFVLPVMLTGHNRSYWKWNQLFQLLSVCSESLCIAKRWSEILGEIQLQPLFTIRALKRTLGFTRFRSQN